MSPHKALPVTKHHRKTSSVTEHHQHRWASTSAFMSGISDIDISYSDIGTKHVGINPLIPISEEFQYQHQLPFQYRTKSKQDIPISKIDKSFPNDPSTILLLIVLFHSNPQSSCRVSGVLPLCYLALQIFESDIGYGTKAYSDIRYNVGLCILQSDIGCSDIRLSPILLITDNGLRAHL